MKGRISPTPPAEIVHPFKPKENIKTPAVAPLNSWNEKSKEIHTEKITGIKTHKVSSLAYQSILKRKTYGSERAPSEGIVSPRANMANLVTPPS